MPQTNQPPALRYAASHSSMLLDMKTFAVTRTCERVKAKTLMKALSWNTQVVVPMPAAVERVSCSYPAEPQPRGSQTWDWQEKQRRLVWKFKKVPGGSEHTLQVQALSCLAAIGHQAGAAGTCAVPMVALAWTSVNTLDMRQRKMQLCMQNGGPVLSPQFKAYRRASRWTMRTGCCAGTLGPSTWSSRCQCCARRGCKCGTYRS
jgi:hypothetical protein